MKIAGVNMVDYGSTGNIMLQIADCAIDHGHDVRTFSKKWRKQTAKREYHSYYGTTLENGIHVVLSRLIGFQGLFSYFGTKSLVRELEKFQPDIIHLHNLHDSSTCLPVLFKYIRKNDIKTVWTLHDCWAMTGQCPHFTMVKCDKWKTGCHDCPQRAARLPIDCSSLMWEKKKKWFTSVKDMVIVTPSEWLADLVKQSYLKEYPVEVINNGINLEMFKPSESQYTLKKKKYLVLGVALGWGQRKGLDTIIKLRDKLDSDYQMLLVGVDESVKAVLPAGIDAINRTDNQKQLAEIYSAADVFINPTREDNFPTTNIESIASGTPVITFDVGGSKEMLNPTCGEALPADDVDLLASEIVRVCTTKPYVQTACVARGRDFDMNKKFMEYVALFEKVSEGVYNQDRMDLR